jgi:hypothetical protein
MEGFVRHSQGRYRGNLRNLSRIIRTTVILTNWQIERHPLRGPDDGTAVEPQEDSDEPVLRII